MTKMAEKATEWWPLMKVAYEVNLPYGVVLRRVLIGEIRGEQRYGRWFVDLESARQSRTRQKQTAPTGKG